MPGGGRGLGHTQNLYLNSWICVSSSSGKIFINILPRATVRLCRAGPIALHSSTMRAAPCPGQHWALSGTAAFLLLFHPLFQWLGVRFSVHSDILHTHMLVATDSPFQTNVCFSVRFAELRKSSQILDSSSLATKCFVHTFFQPIMFQLFNNVFGVVEGCVCSEVKLPGSFYES